MPSRPWYPKYPADYAADTRKLTLEQHGLYNLLIDELWLRGSLPDDAKEIAAMLSMDPRPVSRVYDSIRGFFHVTGGQIASPKLEKLRAEADKVSSARETAARTRWGRKHKGGK